MSTTYTATGTQHSAYVLPSDGDSQSAASVNAPLEALADGVAWCFERLNPYFYPPVPLWNYADGTTYAIAGTTSASFDATPGAGTLDLLSGSSITASSDGDLITTVVSFLAYGATVGAEYRLAYRVNGGTIAEISGARAVYGATAVGSFALAGTFCPGVTGASVNVYLQARSLIAGASIMIQEPWTFTGQHYKWSA